MVSTLLADTRIGCLGDCSVIVHLLPGIFPDQSRYQTFDQRISPGVGPFARTPEHFCRQTVDTSTSNSY